MLGFTHNSAAIFVSEFNPAPLPSHYVLHAGFCCYVLFHFSEMMDLPALLTNARACSFDENTALVCACCWASDGHISAHIFLDCCSTGLASLSANLFAVFFFFFYCPLLL